MNMQFIDSPLMCRCSVKQKTTVDKGLVDSSYAASHSEGTKYTLPNLNKDLFKIEMLHCFYSSLDKVQFCLVFRLLMG